MSIKARLERLEQRSEDNEPVKIVIAMPGRATPQALLEDHGIALDYPSNRLMVIEIVGDIHLQKEER